MGLCGGLVFVIKKSSSKLSASLKGCTYKTEVTFLLHGSKLRLLITKTKPPHTPMVKFEFEKIIHLSKGNSGELYK